MDELRNLYLDLLARCLTDLIYDDTKESIRAQGLDWPERAHTMIGLARLENLRFCIEEALSQNISGDLCEAGAWRGGAAIFMRALLRAHSASDRCVWVADSFQGLPPPDLKRYPQDAGDRHHTFAELSVALEQVQANFVRYGLLDDRVRFLPGWFRDTLPNAPIKQLAVLRLDADMYESTIQALEALYDRIAPGGYLIVDDYGGIEQCRRAVHDFRERRRIHEPIHPIDWTGIYWRREAEPTIATVMGGEVS